MDDWKDAIRKFKPQLDDYYRKRAAEAEKSYLDQQRALVANQYRCHIVGCGVVGIPPAQKTDSDGFPAEDWTKPGNLFKCIECHQDTCVDHRFEGRCQECWVTLREKVLSGA